jgi:hypothetical protein
MFVGEPRFIVTSFAARYAIWREQGGTRNARTAVLALIRLARCYRQVRLRPPAHEAIACSSALVRFFQQVAPGGPESLAIQDFAKQVTRARWLVSLGISYVWCIC